MVQKFVHLIFSMIVKDFLWVFLGIVLFRKVALAADFNP